MKGAADSLLVFYGTFFELLGGINSKIDSLKFKCVEILERLFQMSSRNLVYTIILMLLSL